MVKLNFQHPLLNLQCHMILQKSFWYTDLVLKKHLSILLCSLIFFVETLILLVS